MIYKKCNVSVAKSNSLICSQTDEEDEESQQECKKYRFYYNDNTEFQGLGKPFERSVKESQKDKTQKEGEKLLEAS